MNGNRFDAVLGASPHFRPCPTHILLRPTSRTQNISHQVGSDFEFRMLANVRPCRQCHAWVGHGLKYTDSRLNRLAGFFRSKITPTSGFRSQHSGVGGFPMSADVWPCLQCYRPLSESGMVENVGVAAETASTALSVQKLFPLSVFVADILGWGGGGGLRMSAGVGQCC